ncbi:ImmA/IrrE family metallo-endopeptidase [Trinickia sp. Y13]|uniref:ImmA/IrrE family metallo-endopeptidase n=1 Tax=Trinickia sp. Y13 TaxID=2917807 RepID=UPI0024075D63|nr:ImmA/IrrE family metallo-endopeptidase [Trinickia sp. Y13]MDG0026643.1 ImmA/IrrE family metallo-endopeptidase [Trinickia sp. Y13]
MNPDSSIRFEFLPSEDEAARKNGWGSGILYVLDIPYWYSNSDVQPHPVEWTWVDLLEHVASNWGALVFEQSYPFSWLNDVAHPGDVWNVAERRWARLGDELAEAEETELLAFERRHNLAAAWKGLSLPSLTLMRNGGVCWICVDGRAPIRAPFEECRTALVSICDALAQSFEGSPNPRVASAVNRWRNRGVTAKNSFFRSVTGMSQELLAAVQGDADPFEFWGVAANDPWADGLVEEGPLLAAARMTAGICDGATIRRVLDAIRRVPRGKLDALDRISAQARQHLQRAPAQYAFSSGYAAAEFVRETLGRDRRVRFEIETVFAELGIDVTPLDLGKETIDAVAVWGTRGPCVILNLDRQHISPERTRMTLAHELGHLVLDRAGGLPFCEVLGGTVDDFMERRANAFAAELLLPRSIVEYRRTTKRATIGDFVAALKQDFGVSKSVACAQIYNSHVFASLTSQEQRFLESRLNLTANAFGSQNAIKVQPTGDVM